MLQIIILCLALCTDAFVASIAYGADGIHIDLKRMTIISIIGSACLGAALCFGTLLCALVPDGFTRAVCFMSLLFLALLRLSDSFIKNYINRHCDMHKDIRFSFSRLQFILSIYGNPVRADQDCSRTLSLKETALFGAAMSIDSLTAGTFAAFLSIPILPALLVSFFLTMAALLAGQCLGRRMAKHLKRDISWLGGLLFLALAFSRLR